MKKTLLLFTYLLAFLAMPVLAQQKTVKKHVTFQLLKKRGADAAVALSLIHISEPTRRTQ